LEAERRKDVDVSLRIRRVTLGRGGYTLAEAMMATVIMAVVLASTLAVAALCIRYVTDIRRASRSSQVLQQQMENIRLLPWSQILALPGHFPYGTDATNAIYQGYSGTISSSPFDMYSGTATVLTVTLTVTWTNQSANRVLTNTLTTLICDGGLNKYIF
jgi:type II secretory pathway pseudopilin PulG